jgi:hypothetical protein
VRDDLLFVDFEASSLRPESYPIEVGWAHAGGSGAVLIRPEPGWTDWNPEAAEVHGLSREQLLTEGIPAREAADVLLRQAAGRQLVSDEPERDMTWMARLLALTDLAPDQWPPIADLVDVAWADTARLLQVPEPPGVQHGSERLRCLWAGKRAGRAFAGPRHRAEPDAQRMLAIYLATETAVTATLQDWARGMDQSRDST